MALGRGNRQAKQIHAHNLSTTFESANKEHPYGKNAEMYGRASGKLSAPRASRDSRLCVLVR